MTASLALSPHHSDMVSVFLCTDCSKQQNKVHAVKIAIFCSKILLWGNEAKLDLLKTPLKDQFSSSSHQLDDICPMHSSCWEGGYCSANKRLESGRNTETRPRELLGGYWGFLTAVSIAVGELWVFVCREPWRTRSTTGR